LADGYVLKVKMKRSERHRNWFSVLEEGLEPSRGLRPTGFSYYDSFRYPRRFVVWTFSWPWMSTVGLSRKVSTPSSFHLDDIQVTPGYRDIRGKNRRKEAWLGIASTRRCSGFPEFG